MIEKYIAFTLFYFPMKTVILQQNVSLDLKYRITNASKAFHYKMIRDDARLFGRKLLSALKRNTELTR